MVFPICRKGTATALIVFSKHIELLEKTFDLPREFALLAFQL